MKLSARFIEIHLDQKEHKKIKDYIATRVKPKDQKPTSSMKEYIIWLFMEDNSDEKATPHF